MPIVPITPNNTTANIAGGTISNVVSGTQSSLLGSVTDGLAAAIPDIFKAVPWLRIGEIILGLLLISIGLAQVAGAPAIAKTVAKVVA